NHCLVTSCSAPRMDRARTRKPSKNRRRSNRPSRVSTVDYTAVRMSRQPRLARARPSCKAPAPEGAQPESPFALHHRLEHPVIKSKIGEPRLETLILGLERLQLACVTYLHAALLCSHLWNMCSLIPCLRRTSETV